MRDEAVRGAEVHRRAAHVGEVPAALGRDLAPAAIRLDRRPVERPAHGPRAGPPDRPELPGRVDRRSPAPRRRRSSRRDGGARAALGRAPRRPAVQSVAHATARIDTSGACHPARQRYTDGAALSPLPGGGYPARAHVLQGPGRQPWRDRRPRHPSPRRARHRLRRRLLRGRPRRPARQARRRGLPARPGSGRRVLPQRGQDHGGHRGLRRRGRPPRLRLPGRERRLRQAPGGRGRHVHRPAGERDRGDGLQDPRPRADAEGRRADRPRHHRPGRDARGREEDRRGDRLPDRGQGRGRRRRQGLPRRAGARQAQGRLRGRRPRGREVLLRRHRLPRALPARPAPRRGPGARRQARHGRAPGRARLLDPAPPPEADRGVAPRRWSTPSCARRSARSPPTRPRPSATTARARSRACSRTASTSSWR